MQFPEFHDALFAWWKRSRAHVSERAINLPENLLDVASFFHALFQKEPFAFREWTAVEESVQADERLSSQIGHVVGSYLWRGTRLTTANIGKAFCDEAISAFISDPDLDTVTDDALLENLYASIDAYLAADTVELHAYVPLLGLVCAVHPISLEDGVTLEEIDERDPATFDLRTVARTVSGADWHEEELPPQYRFRLHLVFRLPKLIADDTYDRDNAKAFYADVERKTRDCMRAIAAVRFSRIVAWPARIQERTYRSADSRGLTVLSPQLAAPMFVAGATIEERHAQALPLIWSYLHHPDFEKQDTNRVIGLALDRLARLGTNLHNFPEQLVDAVIACEAFFTLGNRGFRQELGFRASMTAAFSVAEKVGLTKRTAFELVNAAYNTRSRIVHGDELKPKQLNLKTPPQAYPDDVDGRLNQIIFYVAELVRTGILEALLDHDPGAKISVDWELAFFGE